MPFPELTHSELIQTLESVGVLPGDGVLVHSALQLLGKPNGGLQMVFDAIVEVIGPTGTLAVPTFPFTFSRGLDYDPLTTPSQGMGAFSEFVRQVPQALRTTHPMQPVALVGGHAADLAQRDTLSAFDDGSAFDRMLQLGFKMLLLGADIQAASIVHYSEQRAAVPYRYWKDFTGRVKVGDAWKTKTYRMFVRDLDLDAQLKLTPIQRTLEAEGLWRTTKLNFGEVACCPLTAFVAAADELLAANPWVLVTNRPRQVADS
ncbi:MAG: AAC(3) family N-acetyltransferase [Anaerolineales bacterium]